MRPCLALFRTIALFFFAIFAWQAQANFLVSGAGEPDANGIYLEYTTLDGVPAYRKEGGAQTWYLYRCWGELWLIEPYDSCFWMYYYNFSLSDSPPETGWSGWPGPAPTVALAGRSLAYASTVFNESAANDGAIDNSLIITYNEFDGDALTGDLGDDFVADTKVAVANVPAGLTPQLIKTGANELTFSLTGNALNHDQSDSVFDITLEFFDAAFVGGDASGVGNYLVSDIALLNVVTFSGGAGTAGDPFLIGNKLDLQILSENWSDENLWAKHYKQIANISFEEADFAADGAFYNDGAGWTPIGSNSAPFSGRYHGDGHTIANLFINRDEGEQGFFGRLAAGSEITNVGLIDIDFTVRSNSGGLVGVANDGSSIANSYTTGTLTSSSGSVGGLAGLTFASITGSHSTVDIFSLSGGEIGGLVGTAESGTITNCYATGDIEASFRIGGFAGRVSFATVKNSFATGEVTCTSGDCGGFTGLVGTVGRIENSYALGSVIRSAGTSDRFGGFVGSNNQGKILNSYATGSVSFGADVQPDKGFAGDVTAVGNYEMAGNFWDTETSGAPSTAGDATGKTSAEMKTQSTFTAAAWDFTETTGDWSINSTDNNGYPYLQWQTFFETFSVSYNANGADSGSVPASQTKIEDVALTLASNSGNLTRTGFTFAGWNTAADGTGTSFAAGAEYVTNAAVTLYAQWTANEYTISFDSAGGSAVGNITQAFGSAITAPVNPTRAGFTFAGWTPAVPLTMPASNVTVTAQWTINQYTLTFDSAGGSAVASITQDFGTNITIPSAPVREGFTFAGWSPAVPATMPATSQTHTAQWSVNTYTVSFDSAGGSAVASASYGFGAAITAPVAPTREGYTFTGWEPALPDTMPANNVSVTAQWNINSYTVTFVDWDGSVLATDTVTHGSSATAPSEPTRIGFSFTGWSPGSFSNITADITITAQYNVDSFTLSFDSAGGSAVAPIIVDFGAAITAPAAPSREGYTFAGWDPILPAIMPANNVSVTAQWNINSYTVTFVDWDGSVLATDTVTHGSSATAPAEPSRTGFSFTGWSPGSFSNITADTTITAQYNVNSYTLSFDSAGGSAVAAITANFGTAINPPEEPTRLGYTFTGWEPALPETMPSSDVTVTAQWSINQYTLSFDSAEGSDVAAITADFGSAIIAPESPTRAGFAFAGWQPELPTTMPAENQTHTAKWSQNSFTVTATLTGEGSVTPASQQVDFGNSASFDLSVAENTFVHIESSCAASRLDNKIITAKINADCAISLMVYAAVELEVEDTSPAGSLEARRFRLSEGAGEQELTALQQTRSGTAEWLDIADAETLLSLQDDGSYLFSAERTGRYTFEFTDSVSGEQVSVSFDVLPYIAFTASSQPVQQDVAARARVWLSDEPIDYPVRVAIKGEQVLLDSSHLELMAADKRRRALMVTAIASSDGELTLLSDGLEQALLGTPHRQRLTVQSDRPPLVLQARVIQDATEGFVIQQGGGLVELEATELNGVAAEYSWQAAELELSANGATASFDPAGLALGRYYVQLTAAATEQQGELELALNVVADCPVADCSSSGTSGIPASQNPQAGVPHRLPLCPQGSGSNRVTQCQGQSGLFVEVPNQYQLTLGLFSEQQSWQSGQFGAALSEGSLMDTGYQHLGFLVNMDVIGLESPGESVPVAIPMPAGQSIPAGAVWRKLVNFVWQDFVEDEKNQVDSAPRNALGNCPGVSSDAWRPGLNEGDACIRLTIEDGGPNDDDGRVNGVIRDPGVLAVQQTATISFDSAGGSAVTNITELVGSALTPPAAPSREGYTFTGWQPAFPETMPEDGVQLTAQWQINQYVIRFDVAGGQAINDLVLDFGAAINAPTPTRTGYTFTGWSPALPATMPANDLQATAQWQPSSVTVTSKGGSLGVLSALVLAMLVMIRRLRSNKARRNVPLRMLCVSALFLPMLVWADGWYLGVQGGVANSHSSGNLAGAVQRKLNDAGISGTVTQQSNSDTAYRLFAGYQFNDWLSAELGWLDLGEAKLHYDGLPVNQPQATLKAQPQRGRGAELSLVGQLVLDDHWQPYVRLALFDNRSRYLFSGTAAQGPERKSGIRLGAELGIGYQLNNKLQLRAAAAHYDTENFSTRLFSLGLRYSF